jgi:hypothetical protein
MNELDLIKESLQNELKNPQNYENLIHQSASNIANLLILKPILDTLGDKVEDLKKRNQLKRNYKKILKSNVIELLKMLDDPNLNESNVLLIEKLILVSLSKESKPSDELLAYEYLKIAKTLTSSEIVVLDAALVRLNEGKLRDRIDLDDVYTEIAEISDLKFKVLVADVILSLSKKRLFKDKVEGAYLYNTDENYLFTDLGLSFMEYLAAYDTLFK